MNMQTVFVKGADICYGLAKVIAREYGEMLTVHQTGINNELTKVAILFYV